MSLAKGIDPDCLCTFGNFPTTEFLNPQNVDFHCFNVYLHEPKAFENYLARLQMLELDSKRHSDESQTRMAQGFL